jgi:hypothetical protein
MEDGICKPCLPGQSRPLRRLCIAEWRSYDALSTLYEPLHSLNLCNSRGMRFLRCFRHRLARRRRRFRGSSTSSFSQSAPSTSHTADMGDPLSPERLLDVIRSSVLSDSAAVAASSSPSGDEQSSSTSSSAGTNTTTSNAVTVSNSTSLVALLVHSIHTSLGFRQTRPAPPNIDSDGNTSQDPVQRNKVSKEWFENNSREESFAFEYRHDQSSLVFQVRIARLGGRTVVNAVAVEVS